MPAKTDNLSGFLFLILIAALAAVFFDQLTDWPTWVKLIPSIIFALIGLLVLFSSSWPSSSSTATPNPALATTPTKAKPTEKKELEKSGAQALGELIGSLILLGMVVGAIYGIIYIYGLMVNEFNEVKKNYISGRVNTEFIIGHSYNQREETEYDRRLKKDVIYDVFMLKKGQHWKWYFDHDVYYRVRSTVNDEFVLLERLKHTGSEYVAEYDGTLQVKSPTDYNHVTITRLVQY